MTDYGFKLVGCGPHGCQAAQWRRRAEAAEADLAIAEHNQQVAHEDWDWSIPCDTVRAAATREPS